MAELVGVFVEILAGVLQIVGEVIATAIAVFFRAIFSKQTLDDNGESVSNAFERPSNRWRILGFSLLGTTVLSLTVGAICFFVWQSFAVAQWGAGISAFLGGMGAIKAAIE